MVTLLTGRRSRCEVAVSIPTTMTIGRTVATMTMLLLMMMTR